MASKEKERHPKRVGGWGVCVCVCVGGGGGGGEEGHTCKSGEGGKKIEARGRGGWKGRVGGRKGVVRMGGESKMNGGRMRGLGVAESPCVWLDLADSMLSEKWEELGDRFGRWSRLN